MHGTFYLCHQDLAPTHGPGAAPWAALVRRAGMSAMDAAGPLDDPAAALAWAETLQQAGLALQCVRLRCDIRREYDWPRCLQPWCGRTQSVILELAGSSAHDTPSAPRGDGPALALIRQALAAARELRLRVLLQPRCDLWLARAEDAVRLGMRLNRAELGLAFSRWDWLAADGGHLRDRLQLVMYRLGDLTVSGGVREADGACRPLSITEDRAGVLEFLATAQRLGYHGPIGLRAAGPVPDPQRWLQESVQALRRR